ncbi:DUF6220 domain-containing protein [Rossellomorea sp. BNER]|uniref:DUF6220 domain-containing protein n=1 Tax=Rossellomorea sp. BNER TaxID=2962031 RepID=UPI003AF20E9C|nr:DUF6220 domain-containing protein [Rossellomorea sp. BNER]
MDKHKETTRIRLARIGFVLLAIIFTLCIVTQVFFAGLAIFVDPVNWSKHTIFVHIFELVPILMLVTAFIGQLPLWAKWQSVALLGLIFMMYFTANVTTVLPWAAAAHPVIAIIMFWASLKMTRRAVSLLKIRNKQEILSSHIEDQSS